MAEPPVHVDGAAGALEGILEAGNKPDLGPADGLALAAGGFSHEQEPGGAVEATPRLAELADGPIELLAQGVKQGNLIDLGDGAGGALGDSLAQGSAECSAPPPSKRVQPHHQHRYEDEASHHDGHEPPVPEYEVGKPDRATGGGAHPTHLGRNREVI
ncbi:MAG: hypothetical protein NTU53_18835 [Planctomycetota bacterium]|nr:hypothetical protein [Planctomycetota bacterium]